MKNLQIHQNWHVHGLCIALYVVKFILFRKLISQLFVFTSVSSYLQVTRNSHNLSLKRYNLEYGEVDFKIRFKCMSGFTLQNAKFIKPLKGKMSYVKSFDNCDSLDSQTNFVTSHKTHKSSKTKWILEKDLDYKFIWP